VKEMSDLLKEPVEVNIRVSFPDVKVGDIFYESWGYDQTNIDFCQVVEVSKTSKTAKCRMMTQEVDHAAGWLCEYVKPGHAFGVTFRLRVKGTDDLRGSYPFCQRETDTFEDTNKRLGYFSRYKGDPLYQSHYA
jgi:hypothetical protein